MRNPQAAVVFQTATWRCGRFLATMVALMALASQRLPAQDVKEAPAIATPAATPDAASPGRPGGKPGEPGKPPMAGADGKTPMGDAKPGEGEKKPDEPKEPKVIRRDEFLKDANKQQTIDVGLDADGKVTFNFEGILWPTVLDWLAKVSGLSLDWQELPGDYLNLKTQQAYTPEDARDLINRHLLLRGYTLLQDGELLTVSSIKNINPGLVPRISPEELEQRKPHEFVKVSLELDWLLAEEAAQQLAPMMSPNGKLSAIKSVNRLEAMDAVVNLRDVYMLLQVEQSRRRTEKSLVREFKLEHVRAEEAVNLLNGILGIDPKPGRGGGGGGGRSMGMDQMMQMQQQMMQQMQQMAQQNRGGGGGGDTSKPAEPRFVVNSRENSILAHAPPDKMEIISETIKALDVPHEGQHLLQQMDRMKVYRLSTLDPQPLVDILTEIGDLSPDARIKVDEKNRSVVVYGTLSDHVTVQSVVMRLDGSARSFEVIRLRRLLADEVAGTIQYMLGEEEEEKDDRSNGFYRYYSFFDGGQSNEKKEQRPFRIDADVENNRLLVWANEREMEEITTLLVKMGELPSGKSNPETVRVWEADSPEQAQELIERLQRFWPSIKPNELDIRAVPETPAVAPPADAPAADNAVPGRPSVRKSAGLPVRLAQLKSVAPDTPSSEESPAAEVDSGDAVPSDAAPRVHPLRDPKSEELPPADTPPPIAIQRMPDGRILFGSPDTAALDELEDVLRDLAPPRTDYKIFHLKHASTWGYGIEMILDEYFEEEGDETATLDWWGNMVTNNEKGPSRLSRRRQLKIISDDDSRTILVQGATADQLITIERLISIYDQPTSNDPQAVRETKVFRIEYSKAAVIADTIKAVYRDLLSSNDPALQGPNPQEQKPQDGPSFTYVYGRGNEQGDGDKEATPQQPIKFKGLISVGVDEQSNSLVISAANGLMGNITELVLALDEAAKPTTKVELVRLESSLDPARLKARLDGIFSQPKPSLGISTTGDGGPNQNQPQQNGRQNGRRNGQQNGPQNGAPAATAPAGDS